MESVLRPKTRLQKWTAGEFIFEILLAISAGVASSINGFRLLNLEPPSLKLAIFSFVFGGIVFLALVWRAVIRNRRAQGDNELHALEGALWAIYSILTVDKPNGHGLRICVFVPKPNNLVHQLTNYVGPEEPRGVGRDISSRCGVVGLAIRTGQAQYSKLPENGSLVDFLVQAHGFGRAEAVTMKQDRKAWAALPIGPTERVVAVIYFDSSDEKFFGNTASLCRKVIQKAGIGVARFTART